MEKSKRRFSVLLLALCFWTLSSVVALAQKYTVHYQNQTAEQVIRDLRQKTGYEFVYQKDILQGIPEISVYLDNLSIDQLLNSVVRSHMGLAYEVKDKTVVLRKNDNKKVGHLHGRVKDEQGEVLAGATVYIKETRQGVVTDKDGFFDIDVRNGDTFEVSYLGYTPKTMQYVGVSNVNIILVPDDKNTLDDVVVTGIFTKAKESYTGSVSTISAQQLETYRGQNLLQTLKNLDVSMNFAIDNINGSNPNNLPNINIRGNSSLPTSVEEYNNSASNATNTPLIILDGFEIDLEKLMDYNDDEISSINIMKDASATAIYGSRGANGVIVVTTKKPEAGRLKINAEAGFQMEIPDLTSYDLLNAAEKLQLEKDAGLYSSDNYSTDRNYQAAYSRRLLDVLRGVDTDWLHKPAHVGVGQLYKVRLEGGSDEFRWGTSVSWNDINGAMKNSGRKTFNGSITLMYNKKNIAIRNYTAFGVNRSKESNYGTFSDYAKANPYNAPYDEEGNLVHYFPNFYYSGNNVQNPLYDASLNQFNKSGYQDISNNFAIDWTIIEGLIFRAQFGISSKNNHSDVYIPANHSTFVNYTSDEDYLRRGSYTYGTGRTERYDGNFTLSYNKVYKEKHQLYVGLNSEIASTKGVMYNFKAEGFSSEDLAKIFNARQYYQDGAPTGYSTLSHRIGFTGNANYTYDNRYYLDLSYRVDGSSDYGTNKKYAPFFSAGIGWNLHNEAFLKNHEVINNLRLKASYGETGSALSSTSGAITAFEYATNNKYMNWTGAYVTGLGNEDLTWQKTKELNAGIEWGLWKDRFKGTFEVYNKVTNNLLSYMELPHATGVTQYAANVGEVKNNGWELYISGYPIRNYNKHFNWMISGQLTYNKNKISKLSEAIKKQNEEYMASGADVATLFFEGRPQSSIYAVKSMGIDPSTGEEVYLDKNGNITETWNAGDKVYCGQTDPKYRGIISNLIQWKGWQLNLSFSYYWGGQMYNSTLLNKVEVTKSTLTRQNVDARVLSERWFQPGDNTFYKKLSDVATRATSRFVMDNNVFELSSAQLQYRWTNADFLKKLHMSTLTLGVNMSDIFYLSSIKVERGTSYPFSRNLQGTLKATF